VTEFTPFPVATACPANVSPAWHSTTTGVHSIAAVITRAQPLGRRR
jgi:hypothetical protein